MPGVGRTIPFGRAGCFGCNRNTSASPIPVAAPVMKAGFIDKQYARRGIA
jgi:hypothetical protein